MLSSSPPSSVDQQEPLESADKTTWKLTLGAFRPPVAIKPNQMEA